MATFISPFQPISMTAIAQYQYGPQAGVWEMPNHAYGWAARKPNDNNRYPLDLHAYTKAIYGGDCRVVQRNFGGAGWARFYPLDKAHDWTILPVILVASDQIMDVPGINVAIENYRYNVGVMADWYQSQLGKRLTILEPQLFGNWRNSDQWLQIYKDQTDRYDLWNLCQQEVVEAYGKRINPNIIYLVTQYCGLHPDWDWDAAGGPMSTGFGFLSVVSAFACCWKFQPNTPSPYDETVIYAMGHEVGHCFGLPHTSSDQPGWQNSIMQRGMLPTAILTDVEKSRLQTSPFFK